MRVGDQIGRLYGGRWPPCRGCRAVDLTPANGATA